MNQSDIVHYFQGGAPLTYHLIHPDGTHERHVLGPDVAAGHTMQVRSCLKLYTSTHIHKQIHTHTNTNATTTHARS